MKYQRNGSTAVVRLEAGDEITKQLFLFAEKENVGFASIEGIGASDDFTVGVFDLSKKAYENFRFTGDHEITSLAGTLSRMNGKPYSHLHITCAGMGGSVVGGHLIEAKISITAEIVVRIESFEIGRVRDGRLGVNLLAVGTEEEKTPK